MNKSSLFLQHLGLRYPIIQAPMAGISTPELAATVSEAGGLGSLGLGACNVDQARNLITQTQKLTNKPFSVNVFCHKKPKRNIHVEKEWIDYFSAQFDQFQASAPQQLNEVYLSFLDNPQMLALFLELKPKVVSFHFNIPKQSIINQLKAHGIYTMATATNLAEAKIIEHAGIDGIVAQGIEAGGHRGMFDVELKDEQINTHHLVNLLIKQTNLPIIAAGGIMDGFAVNAYLKQGAVAAQLGTAFILCPESAANADYRARLRNAKGIDTALTSAISGRPARGIINSFIRMGQAADRPVIPDYPITYDLGKQLNAAANQFGRDDFAAHWAGTSVDKIREMPAQDLMATLVKEMGA
ncbi:NAD(P)H-dependent flavin oxidoreductase [Providencia sneebia]|uniref:Nitronate monooxygenase n=1 Tax=Providencia sneebia DSM 19967 TaxID=1141660 RepID=K8WKD0_9GAMM|nr:nitronate monooxygenase [Providencia sneebia]EKT61009.1 2-nitropropane dioxygenase [Providencia sneebia DSM 19967]